MVHGFKTHIGLKSEIRDSYSSKILCSWPGFNLVGVGGLPVIVGVIPARGLLECF